MQPRRADRIGLWVIMAVWLASFFLPAITPALGSWGSDNPKDDILAGFWAVILSAFQLGIAWAETLTEIRKGHATHLTFPLLASTGAWFANVWMFLAPAFFRRVCAKKGAVYLALMLFSSFLIVVLPLFNGERTGIKAFHYGYLIWGLSIALMSLFLLGLRLQAGRPSPQGQI